MGPAVLLQGPIREGRGQWSVGVTCRLVDPHTNVGSMALAVIVPRVVCVCVCMHAREFVS